MYWKIYDLKSILRNVLVPNEITNKGISHLLRFSDWKIMKIMTKSHCLRCPTLSWSLKTSAFWVWLTVLDSRPEMQCLILKGQVTFLKLCLLLVCLALIIPRFTLFWLSTVFRPKNAFICLCQRSLFLPAWTHLRWQVMVFWLYYKKTEQDP